MRHFAIYDLGTGKIIIRVKSSGQQPSDSDSIELSEDEANAEPPIEHTHTVDKKTRKLKKKGA